MSGVNTTVGEFNVGDEENNTGKLSPRLGRVKRDSIYLFWSSLSVVCFGFADLFGGCSHFDWLLPEFGLALASLISGLFACLLQNVFISLKFPSFPQLPPTARTKYIARTRAPCLPLPSPPSLPLPSTLPLPSAAQT